MSTVVELQDLDILQKAFWEEAKYTPSWAQKQAHDNESRVKLVIGGVRGGKSKYTAMEKAKKLFKPDSLIWIIGPDYDQAAAEFDYIYHPLKSLGMISKESIPSTGSKTLTTHWNCKVETLSIQQGLEHIASFAPDSIALVEAGQHPYTSVEKAFERALEKDADITISGTLEKNKYPWLATKYREWGGDNEVGARSFSLPSWSNEFIFPGGRDDPKIKSMEAALSKAKFMERCAAVPLKPEGLVFPEFEYSKHVDDMKIHPDVPIGLAVDPGYGGAYAVVFMQKIGAFYNCLSEVYVRRTKARNVIDAVKKHPLAEHVKYMVIDVAAKQHHASDSQEEIWENLWPELTIFSNKVGILDGIEVLASRLKEDPVIERPYLMFSPDFSSEIDHDGGSLGTFAEFDLYMWADRGRGSNERMVPLDANNHALKAISYFIYHHDGTFILNNRPMFTQKKRGYWN